MLSGWRESNWPGRAELSADMPRLSRRKEHQTAKEAILILSLPRSLGAHNMIRVGIAGIGFMGMTHYLAYQKIRGVKVAALCEQDAKRLAGDWRSIKGNFGPAGRNHGPRRHRPVRRTRRDARRSEPRPDRLLPAAVVARQGDHRRA